MSSKYVKELFHRYRTVFVSQGLSFTPTKKKRLENARDHYSINAKALNEQFPFTTAAGTSTGQARYQQQQPILYTPMSSKLTSVFSSSNKTAPSAYHNREINLHKTPSRRSSRLENKRESLNSEQQASNTFKTPIPIHRPSYSRSSRSSTSSRMSDVDGFSSSSDNDKGRNSSHGYGRRAAVLEQGAGVRSSARLRGKVSSSSIDSLSSLTAPSSENSTPSNLSPRSSLGGFEGGKQFINCCV